MAATPVVGVAWQQTRTFLEIVQAKIDWNEVDRQIAAAKASAPADRGVSGTAVGLVALGVLVLFVLVGVVWGTGDYERKIRQHIRKAGFMKFIGYAGLALMLGCFLWAVVQTKGIRYTMRGEVMTPWLVMGGIIGGVSVALLFLATRERPAWKGPEKKKRKPPMQDLTR